jgi:hypothetical protein
VTRTRRSHAEDAEENPEDAERCFLRTLSPFLRVLRVMDPRDVQTTSPIAVLSTLPMPIVRPTFIPLALVLAACTTAPPPETGPRVDRSEILWDTGALNVFAGFVVTAGFREGLTRSQEGNRRECRKPV